MADFAVINQLAQENESKIVLLVMDGLGGLPMAPGGPTELEAAFTPNLDRLASEGACGLSTPIGPGISPGSGPAHLALFGYDALKYRIGRGVLEALGIGFDLHPEDVAARGNFCTVDKNGLITDRRAGRIPTEECARLSRKLQQNTNLAKHGVEIFVRPIKEHRFLFVMRGEQLSSALSETDPLQTGKPSLPVEPLEEDKTAQRTAALVNEWLTQARQVLADEHPANSVNLRGFAKDPRLPQFPAIFKMRSAAIATYPMYRGVARLVGMELVDAGQTTETEIAALKRHWDEYDFFFIHFKYTDSRGEDGNFEAKARVIEEVDRHIPDIIELNPSILVVTGDHSTPAALKAHSWHPVPTLFWGPTVLRDNAMRFGERACQTGGLGHFHATDLIPMAMGHAGRLSRYGA
ncbi:MAG TPA: 2,3-bisphosphoglycerate-independent phosphoglycerate mutase [Anaerolineae bacterium]|nr:2,3-bisphosphoglycerate-independent phosphoglycerate mutase [Anaerolineae bacterium]